MAPKYEIIGSSLNDVFQNVFKMKLLGWFSQKFKLYHTCFPLEEA